MAFGQLDFGSRPKRLAQWALDGLLERFPLERLWSKWPLVTVTNEVLGMSEVRDAVDALRVSWAEVVAQVAKHRKTMVVRFPQEFRDVVVAGMVAVSVCLVAYTMLFTSAIDSLFGVNLIRLPRFRTDWSYLSHEIAQLLTAWQSGDLSRSRLYDNLVRLLLREVPYHNVWGYRSHPLDGWGYIINGWIYIIGGALGGALVEVAAVGLLCGVIWVVWRYVSRALHAHQRWRDKLREAVLLQVRTVVNTMAQQCGITVLMVDRAPGLHGHGEPAHLVPPPEMTRIRVLIEELGAGVIAVSGDRGVGKTTLLRALADPRYRKSGSNELRLMLAAPVDYDAREFLVHLYLSLCELVCRIERPRGLSLFAAESRWKRLWSILFFCLIMVAIGVVAILVNPDLAEPLIGASVFMFPIVVTGAAIVLLPSSPSSVRATESEIDMPIERLARHRLNQLRFQQTIALEHVGGLRPTWLELSRRTSRQFADRPMTLPELVESYRAFTDRVVTWWRGRNKGRGSIVIGIDEVDRIADAAQAERFLNEVKAIFDVHHCAYLVSVSEEALASFERRVVRVRTVLDSAFDEVLRIDVLDLNRALELLGRRVIGVPAPFLALCHCLSGGVARDLIRVARVMFDIRQSTGLTNISELAIEIVHREVQTLKRGFATRVVNLAVGSTADGLLALLVEPGWPGSSAAQILTAVRTDLVDVEHEAGDISQARTELASALSFYATVLELFTDRAGVIIEAVMSNTEKVVKLGWQVDRLSADETIEALARARGALSMSPGLVRYRLDRIRYSLGLSALAEPIELPGRESFDSQGD